MSLYSFFAKFDFEHFFEIFFYFSHGHSSKNAVNFFFAVFSKVVALDSANKNAEYIKSEKFHLHAQNPKNVEKITTFFTDFFRFSTTALELLKILRQPI